jgi:hypothetical protein
LQEQLKAFIFMAMRQPRSDYWHGYLTGMCDLYGKLFDDRPTWLTEALKWYE